MRLRRAAANVAASTSFPPQGMSSNTGGTDHQSFDAVGIPGFQFIQDGIDYNTRTHHSNMDLYERLQPKDMMRIMTALHARFRITPATEIAIEIEAFKAAQAAA